MRVAALANRSPSRRVPGARFAHTPSRAAQRGRTTIECGSMAWPGGGAPMRISTAGLLLVTAFILVGCVHETREIGRASCREKVVSSGGEACVGRQVTC